jgi:carboxylesterase type B
MIDDDFLLQSATTQLLNGQFVKVPILIGTNFDEGASFSPQNVNTSDQFRKYLIGNGVTTEDAALDALIILYPDLPSIGIPATLTGRDSSLGLQFKRCAAMIGDVLMHAPRRLTTEIWAANNLSSYSYHFNVVPNGVSSSFGSVHGAEIPFVFNNYNADGYAVHGQVNPFADKPDSYKELVRLMTRQWSSFVATLDPNESGGMYTFLLSPTLRHLIARFDCCVRRLTLADMKNDL